MTDNTALAQELETLRSRETQMLGAAISRRNWQDVEAAYNQLRDRQDGPIAAVLRTPAPAPVGGDVVGLLNAILDAQNAQPYRGWNITKLNKAVDAAREHLGLPSIRELNPDIAAMQDHARANKDAIQSALQAQPAPAQGDDVVEATGRWTSSEHLRRDILISLHRYDEHVNQFTGEVERVPHSMAVASMPRDEFERLYDDTIRLLTDALGADPEMLTQEAA